MNPAPEIVVSSSMTTPPGALQPPRRTPVIPADLVPERAGAVAFVSSQVRTGDWLLPRLFRVACVLGNVEIDLTRARVAPGTSHIEIRALFGNVEIKAPPDLRVECTVGSVASSVEVTARTAVSTDMDAPLITIGGTAVFGNLEVTIVDPNAPGWMERLAKRLKR